MTCSKNLKTNHIELFEYILKKNNFSKYILDLTYPIRKFNTKLVRCLIKNSFYLRKLSRNRKYAIIKTLEMRKKILTSIMESNR